MIGRACHEYWVYIVANRSRTTLYVGVTNCLRRRVAEHRNGEIAGFTRDYNLNRLVFFEYFDFVEGAILREKQIKGWRRSKKEILIGATNPRWEDLAVTVLEFEPATAGVWEKLARKGTASKPSDFFVILSLSMDPANIRGQVRVEGWARGPSTPLGMTRGMERWAENGVGASSTVIRSLSRDLANDCGLAGTVSCAGGPLGNLRAGSRLRSG